METKLVYRVHNLEVHAPDSVGELVADRFPRLGRVGPYLIEIYGVRHSHKFVNVGTPVAVPGKTATHTLCHKVVATLVRSGLCHNVGNRLEDEPGFVQHGDARADSQLVQGIDIQPSSLAPGQHCRAVELT